MAFLAAIFQEAAGVNVASMTQSQARKLDGAIYGVGSLASILQKSKTYKPQIPSLFQTYILPTFASPYGHVRAKACWVSSEFASVLHAVSPEIFMQLLQHMQALLNDPELPVQVDAAIAMREFFSNIDEEQVQQYGFLQVLPSLLAKFLELANTVDSEGIMETIECVVDKFGEHIGPYAFDVASALVTQFWKIVNVEEGDDDVFTDALAGHQVLGTIATVLEAVSKSPEILAQMEGLLFPIFEKFVGESGMDVIEEILEIITQLTFYSPAISERMWTLFPRVLEIMPTWGVDFFQEFIPVVDNYISRGTPVFIQQYLPATNAMLEAALVRFQTSEEGDGFGTEEEVYSGVAEIIQVILENCKGMVDTCVKPYTSLVVAAMMKNDPPNEPFEDPHVIEALLIAGADALYYNPVLTMNSMQENGHLAYFMQALGQAVSRRKKRSGKLYHFASKREKKTVILGLAAVMATPPGALMPGMRHSIPQISAAAVALLMDLKKQEEASTRPGTGASGLSVPSQSSTDFDSRYLSDSGDDDDGDDDDDDYDDGTDFLAELRRLRGTSGGDDLEQDEALDDLLLSLHDDDHVLISPLDDVCAYTTFKEACARLRGGDEPGFLDAVGLLNEDQKAWLEHLLSSQ
jgi:importin-7